MGSYTHFEVSLPFPDGSPARAFMQTASEFSCLANDVLTDPCENASDWPTALGPVPVGWLDGDDHQEAAKPALIGWAKARGIPEDVAEVWIDGTLGEDYGPFDLEDGGDTLDFEYEESSTGGGAWQMWERALQDALRLHAPDVTINYTWVDGDRVGHVEVTAEGVECEISEGGDDDDDDEDDEGHDEDGEAA